MAKIYNNNGNGTVTINSKIAFWTFLILLFSVIISIVSLAVTAQGDIAKNTEEINEWKEINKEIVDTVNKQENQLTTLEVQYEHIANTLSRIEDKLEQVK